MAKRVQTYCDQVGERYADWQAARYTRFQSLFDEVSWRQLSPFVPEQRDARILDAGCGGGGWSLRLAELGYTELTLLDISAGNLAGARRVFAERGASDCATFVQCDLEEGSELLDESFDFVFCERDPLEYCVEQQDRAFGELSRVLRPGGVLTLSNGTRYGAEQRLLAKGKYAEFVELQRTGVYTSDEGPLRPLWAARVLELFAAHGIAKLQLSGRLTVADWVDDDAWAKVYEDPALKERILAVELRYQQNESLTDACSHLFAAGRKK